MSKGRLFVVRAALVAVLPMVAIEAFCNEAGRAWRNFNLRYELRRQMQKWRKEWREAE